MRETAELLGMTRLGVHSPPRSEPPGPRAQGRVNIWTARTFASSKAGGEKSGRQLPSGARPRTCVMLDVPDPVPLAPVVRPRAPGDDVVHLQGDAGHARDRIGVDVRWRREGVEVQLAVAEAERHGER